MPNVTLMTTMEQEKLEQFLLESFGEGQPARELRLSQAEVAFIHSCYPEISLKQCVEYYVKDNTDGKRWHIAKSNS